MPTAALVPTSAVPAIATTRRTRPGGHARDIAPPAAITYCETPVAHHGGQYVAPWRRAVAGAWHHPSPEVCDDDRPYGVWIGAPDRPDEQVLVCVSCGLDCT
ncbi:hypothetical protein [Dactylosporangium sp. CA-233914]|uniref:hypothetical protein n=1 Tax=Dactylosporangium sp. CA-233914 TaxID=3239934 RepID=UPI003D92898B